MKITLSNEFWKRRYFSPTQLIIIHNSSWALHFSGPQNWGQIAPFAHSLRAWSYHTSDCISLFERQFYNIHKIEEIFTKTMYQICYLWYTYNVTSIVLKLYSVGPYTANVHRLKHWTKPNCIVWLNEMKVKLGTF